MVRSAQALLAVLILSGFVAVQQVATHEVVKGDTLWDLAEHYYQNPFDWRRIWEANQQQVADPNLILPGWVLTIPGREAQVTDVAVETPGEPAAEPAEEPMAPPAARSLKDEATIFDQDTSVIRSGVLRSSSAQYSAVPRGLVWSAPWLIRQGQSDEPMGRIESFAGGASNSETARSYDRIRVSFTGSVPAVGTVLQAYRLEKTIEDVGEVMIPTGVVTIAEAEGDGAIAVVSAEYARMTLGDFLRPVPEYTLAMGNYAQPVNGGPQAMVMGFSGPNVLQDIGSIAFLDQGAQDGVSIGDEYEYVNPSAGSDVVEGRLQVVGVTPDMASARILSMDDVVFKQGVVVRLARKMR